MVNFVAADHMKSSVYTFSLLSSQDLIKEVNLLFTNPPKKLSSKQTIDFKVREQGLTWLQNNELEKVGLIGSEKGRKTVVNNTLSIPLSDLEIIVDIDGYLNFNKL